MTTLQQCELFKTLPEGELAGLRTRCVEKVFPAGAIIFQEGDNGDGIYIVCAGIVQISALVGQGQDRRVLTRIQPGEFFGEMAVIDDEPRSATAMAEVETRVYFIARGDLLELLDSSPRLAVNLMREFSQRMRDFNRHYIQEVLQAERLTLVGRFARSIVHDFKNPLNIIGLASEVMNMEMATPVMRKTATQRIRKQVDRLSNMITELLEFTRGPQNAVVMAVSDYGAFASAILDELGPEVQDKGVTVVRRNATPSARVAMDEKRLVHVFANLIHNAVDAMPDGGTIYVDFKLTPEEVVTEIEDSGSGIPEEILPRLFEAFATFGKAKGTGLGLSICRKIVEDHGGWIKARNEQGRGAVFSFSLPLAPG